MCKARSGGRRLQLAPTNQASEEGRGSGDEEDQAELCLSCDQRHHAGDVKQDGIDEKESVQVHGGIVNERRR